MKTLETIIGALSWIVFGIVLWAIAPFLLKLMEMAQYLHNGFK